MYNQTTATIMTQAFSSLHVALPCAAVIQQPKMTTTSPGLCVPPSLCSAKSQKNKTVFLMRSRQTHQRERHRKPRRRTNEQERVKKRTQRGRIYCILSHVVTSYLVRKICVVSLFSGVSFELVPLLEEKVGEKVEQEEEKELHYKCAHTHLSVYLSMFICIYVYVVVIRACAKNRRRETR